MTGPATDLETGLTALIEQMQPRIKRILRSFRIPVCDADDIVQATLLSLVRNWATLRCPEAWLVRGLIRGCWQYNRQRRAPRLQYLEVDSLEELAPALEPEQERAALRLDLASLLAPLPFRQRQLLRYRFVLGLSSAETAERLGYRPTSIRNLSLRALAQLRSAT